MTSNGSASGLSPSGLLRIVQRRKWYLIAPALIITPAVCFYASRLPKKYRAKALVGVESVLPGQPAPADRANEPVLSAEEQMRAVREMLFSGPVLGDVSREFHRAAPGDAKGTDDLKSRIQIQIEGPETFDLGVEGSDPAEVTQLANRLASRFVEETSALRGKKIEQHDTALDEEVDRLRREMTAQEEGLKAYQERVSQDLPERLATNLRELETLQQQIQAKNDQITDASARRASITEELAALEKQGVLREEAPAKTQDQIAADELRLKLADLKTKYTPQHLDLQRTEQELADLEARMPKTVTPAHQPSPAQLRYYGLQAELKSIDPRLKSYEQERDGLAASVAELEKRIDATPALETGVSQRTKEAAMLRSRYEALFAKQQEAQLKQREEKTDGGSTYRIIEAAAVPSTPYSPKTDRILFFGALAGLALGVLGAFAAEQLDDTFETGEEVQAFTTIPLAATVPPISTKPGKLAAAKDAFRAEQRRFYQKHRIAVLGDPESLAAQQYSVLALKMRQRLQKTGGQVLLVTSAGGAEGKSVTAINLALALAATAPGRVLLLDADLRLPQVQTRLDLGIEEGLGELLAGTATNFDPYISHVGELDVISGGQKLVNPTQLLTSSRTSEVLDQLRQRYHYIVVDSPPVVPIADSQILSGLADGVLIVVRARQTKPDLLRRAVESLEDAPLLGVALNDAEYAPSYAYAYQYHQRRYVSGR